jgi:hypothetical protein
MQRRFHFIVIEAERSGILRRDIRSASVRAMAVMPGTAAYLAEIAGKSATGAPGLGASRFTLGKSLLFRAVTCRPHSGNPAHLERVRRLLS